MSTAKSVREKGFEPSAVFTGQILSLPLPPAEPRFYREARRTETHRNAPARTEHRPFGVTAGATVGGQR
jgi:hypothetical protein